METQQNYIKPVTFQALDTLDEDNSPITGTGVDTKEEGAVDSPSFDGAYIQAITGAKGADVTAIKIKVVESDASNMADATVAEGGTEATVLENTVTKFQIKRSKRYLASVVTLTATGAADTVPVAIVGILNNWAKPFPVI